MGLAIIVHGYGECPSAIDMSVSFLASARAGRLTVEAVAIRAGKTIAFVEGELRDDAGDT